MMPSVVTADRPTVRGTAYLEATSPCVEALMDLGALRVYAEANGYRVVDHRDDADVILIQTCGVDQLREDRATARIAEIHDGTDPGQQVVVTGCLARIHPERIETVHDGPTIAPGQMEELDALLGAEIPHKAFDVASGSQEIITDDIVKNIPVRGARLYRRFLQGANWLDARMGTEIRHTLHRTVHYQVVERMGYLRIGQGCLGQCGFCAIKAARGQLRSVSPARVEASLRRQLEEGKRCFYVVSTDAGAYGLDLGTDLADLLSRLLAVDGDFELAVDYLSPDHLVRMADRLLPLLADPRVRFTCIPVQSGSQKVLDTMVRPYEASAVSDALIALSEVAPKLVVKTIFMVGHPGEGLPEFGETVDFIQRTPIQNLTVLTYTPRPRTRSARLPDHVPGWEKRRRRLHLFGEYLLARGLQRPGYRAA